MTRFPPRLRISFVVHVGENLGRRSCSFVEVVGSLSGGSPGLEREPEGGTCPLPLAAAPNQPLAPPDTPIADANDIW